MKKVNKNQIDNLKIKDIEGLEQKLLDISDMIGTGGTVQIFEVLGLPIEDIQKGELVKGEISKDPFVEVTSAFSEIPMHPICYHLNENTKILQVVYNIEGNGIVKIYDTSKIPYIEINSFTLSPYHNIRDGFNTQFNKTGTVLATGLYLWDCTTIPYTKKEKSLHDMGLPHQYAVFGVEFTNNDKWLVISTFSSGWVWVFDLETETTFSWMTDVTLPAFRLQGLLDGTLLMLTNGQLRRYTKTSTGYSGGYYTIRNNVCDFVVNKKENQITIRYQNYIESYHYPSMILKTSRYLLSQSYMQLYYNTWLRYNDEGDKVSFNNDGWGGSNGYLKVYNTEQGVFEYDIFGGVGGFTFGDLLENSNDIKRFMNSSNLILFSKAEPQDLLENTYQYYGYSIIDVKESILSMFALTQIKPNLENSQVKFYTSIGTGDIIIEDKTLTENDLKNIFMIIKLNQTPDVYHPTILIHTSDEILSYEIKKGNWTDGSNEFVFPYNWDGNGSSIGISFDYDNGFFKLCFPIISTERSVYQPHQRLQLEDFFNHGYCDRIIPIILNGQFESVCQLCENGYLDRFIDMCNSGLMEKLQELLE